MKIDSQYSEKFESRHIGPDSGQAEAMLKLIKAKSLDELIEQTIPNSIRLKKPLDLPAAKSEFEFLNDLKKLASKNKVFKSYIGTGYYNTITPGS
jgi:glycine dehydrogenase